jgi:hypothetical protein
LVTHQVNEEDHDDRETAHAVQRRDVAPEALSRRRGSIAHGNGTSALTI